MGLRRSWLVIGAVFVGSPLAGCGQKTAECNSVVDVVNSVGPTKEEGQPSDAKAHAAALKNLAAGYDQAAEKMGRLNLTTPELKKSTTALQAVFKQHAEASRAMVTLLEKLPDEAASKAMEAKVTAARELLESAETEVEHFCDSKPDDCLAFAEKLRVQPEPSIVDLTDPAKTKDFAASVEKWTAELATVDVQEPALKKELASIQKGLKEMAGILVQLAALSGDAAKKDQAQQALEKASQNVAAEVDGLNKFCQAP